MNVLKQMEMRDDILMEVNKINKAIKTKKRIKRMKKKQEEPEASQPEMKADDRKFKRHLDSYLLTDDSNRAFGIDIGEHNGARSTLHRIQETMGSSELKSIYLN